MPILTKPASVVKNVNGEFSLNKTSLAGLPLISADSYFSNDVNWKKVTLHYKSTSSKQYENVIFDATQSQPTAQFFVSEFADDVFVLQHIIVHDFDNGYIFVSRADIPSAGDFDVNMAS
jgi:hypothetical protein